MKLQTFFVISFVYTLHRLHALTSKPQSRSVLGLVLRILFASNSYYYRVYRLSSPIVRAPFVAPFSCPCTCYLFRAVVSIYGPYSRSDSKHPRCILEHTFPSSLDWTLTVHNIMASTYTLLTTQRPVCRHTSTEV